MGGISKVGGGMPRISSGASKRASAPKAAAAPAAAAPSPKGATGGKINIRA